MADETTSPKFSFAGWNWKAWLGGNKEALKLLLSALTALAASALTPWRLAAFAASKLLLDLLDYWVTVQN